MAKRSVYFKQLADRIDQIMVAKNISRKELAAKLGITPTVLSSFFVHGEKLPADRIDQMLDIVGYELAPVEKKAPQLRHSPTTPLLAPPAGLVSSSDSILPDHKHHKI